MHGMIISKALGLHAVMIEVVHNKIVPKFADGASRRCYTGLLSQTGI